MIATIAISFLKEIREKKEAVEATNIKTGGNGGNPATLINHPHLSYPQEITTMSRYKLHISHYVIAISGFARDQPVWFRQQLKVHKGPTIELTIAFPQDAPARFNVPFPVTPYILRKLVARHWGILWPDQLKLLHDRIYEFAADVFDNQSWYRPYRPFTEGFEDCVALAWPVTAKGSVGSVHAEEYVKSWFP